MTLPRKLLLILATLTIVGLAAAAFFLLRLDPETVRETLERRLTAASGQPVRIGSLEFQLLPPGFTVNDLGLGDRGEEILTVARARGGFALLPLLRKEVKLSRLALVEPRLTLRPGRAGFPPPEGRGQRTAFSIANVSVQDGALQYLNGTDGARSELTGLDLKLTQLGRDEMGHLAIAGDLRGERLRVGRIEAAELAGAVAVAAGHGRLDHLRGRLFGSEAKGKVEIDLTGEHPAWRGELAAEALSLADLFQNLAGRPLFEGQVEVRAELAGGGPGGFVDTLDGRIKISGSDLIQHGFDLDRFIREYRASKEIDLIDIGAYAFAGPVGALVTKGVDVGRLVWPGSRGERQVIEELVFDWSLRDGVARTEDVALRTGENRLALKGSVDLVAGRYQEMTLGLLNAEGCAVLTETISGPLASPTVERSVLLDTIAGPLIGILRLGWKIIDPKDCRTFYQGAVTHPGRGND